MQQRFERRCGEHGSEDRRRDPGPDAFGRAGPTIEVPTATADRMHALLVMRADALEGCTEGSPGEPELAALVDVIEAYEAIRSPLGKEPGGGKGSCGTAVGGVIKRDGKGARCGDRRPF